MIRYLWLGVAFGAAFVLSEPLYDSVSQIAISLARDVSAQELARLMRTDPLVGGVGQISAAAVVLTIVGFAILAAVEGVLVAIARRRIITARETAGPKAPFTKNRLRDAISHAPFLDTLTRPYVDGLLPTQAERKNLLLRGKSSTGRYESLEAVRPAGEFVGPGALVDRRLFLWLF
ncbi:MAG: hypothetical protein D6763_01660, partial [Alphaproteobacteria bacterium]